MIKWFLGLFKAKNVIEAEVFADCGTFCPLCKQDGGLFFYGDIYLCENCVTKMTVEQYKKLL